MPERFRGFAWEPFNNTLARGGYGIHYTVGQYSSFIQYLAYQPPFANVQANGNQIVKIDFGKGPVYLLLNALKSTFSNSMAGVGNYAINPHYRLPYIQIWYANVQQTLPLQIVLDASYIGSKGTRLDTVTAPGFLNTGGILILFFDSENALAFSSFNAMVLTATKHLQSGLAAEAIASASIARIAASSSPPKMPPIIDHGTGVANADAVKRSAATVTRIIRLKIIASSSLA